MTSELQSLNVAIKKPFKDMLRRYYTDWLTEQEHGLMPTGCIKRASLRQVENQISAAWQGIQQELMVVIKPFKKCSISNSLHGSDDWALWVEVTRNDFHR